MWRMLRSSWLGVTQGCKCFGDISRHGNVDMSCGVVPIDSESEVVRAGPVCGDNVFGGEGVEKVFSVGLAEKFNAEVINCQGKGRGTGGVAP